MGSGRLNPMNESTVHIVQDAGWT